MNRDKLFAQSPETAAAGAFQVINGVQRLPSAQQAIGVATAYKQLCESIGIDPRELLYVVARMEADCRYRNVNTLSAVRKYIDRQVTEKL